MLKTCQDFVMMLLQMNLGEIGAVRAISLTLISLRLCIRINNQSQTTRKRTLSSNTIKKYKTKM